VIGGCSDVLVLRIQLDYVRLGLNGLRKENTRVFAGEVVPLCFRACQGHAEDFSSIGK
jgi:hypothetical protein